MIKYCEAPPILTICEVQPKEMGLPVHAYHAIEAIREDGTAKPQRVFANLPTKVGSTEAEEIGVEHLLRDVKDATFSTLSADVGEMVMGLRGLHSRLREIQAYLDAVLEGKLPINHDIMRNLQDVFNLLPSLDASGLTSSFTTETNDMMLVVYLSSLIRSVIALHALIENKEARAAAEKDWTRREKERTEEGTTKKGANGVQGKKEKEEGNGTAADAAGGSAEGNK
jgi:26S proteasome regulatory subunit N8